MDEIGLVGVLLPLTWSFGLQWLHRDLRRWERVAVARRFAVSLTLCRLASLEVPQAGAFPVPRESRARIWCCLGLPVWVSRRSIGLPAQTDACIDAISAQAFDDRFSASYRLDAPAAAFGRLTAPRGGVKLSGARSSAQPRPRW